MDDVTRFWAELSPGDRESLRIRRQRRVLARFVEPGADIDDDASRWADFYEYLVNHEILIEPERPFHICTAHPEARAAVRRAHVPADFRCPLANAGCPMRKLLDACPGRDVRFTLARGDR